MSYVFFGSPRFAAIILKKLLQAGIKPAAVVSSPDKPVGRKQIITPPPVKTLAKDFNIEVLQPEKIDEGLLNRLKAINAQFYLVAAYAKILPEELLNIPPLGVIGVHPSLLPKFRGPSPIQATILSGEKETGVSLFLLDKKVDHGPIISSWKIKIEDENYEDLEEKLANLAGDLLITTLPQFTEGQIKVKRQNEIEATYTKKIETSDAYVAPEKLEEAINGNANAAAEIERMVRALNPEPGVWTVKDGKRIKLLETKVVDNRLKLIKIQEAGKKPVSLAN